MQFSLGVHALTWMIRFFRIHLLGEEDLGTLRGLQFIEVLNMKDSW